MRRLLVAQAVLTEVVLADLVARSRDGDKKAWGRLWLALEPLIARFAHHEHPFRVIVSGRSGPS